MKVKIVILALMLMSSIVGVALADDIDPEAGPNYMSFTFPSGNAHKIIGSGTFTTYVWVEVNSEIDTVGLYNLTYQPAGIIYYTSQVKGNLFTQVINDNGWSDTWIQPGGGGIHNLQGYVQGWSWGIFNPSPPPAGTLNNSDGTLTTVTWTPQTCGKVTLNMLDDGSGLGTTTLLTGLAVGTTITPMDVFIHPQAITGLDAVKDGSTEIDLSWTKHTGDDKTLIRYRSDAFPTSVTDGTELYNNTGTSTSLSGLSSGDTRYFSAWGWNNTGSIYSYTYATDSAQTNRVPVLGTPSPVNNSIGQAPSFTWSIPISDPDVESVSWTIQCSNGQTNSGSGGAGTKSLSIGGLAPLTLYTVWVNASDVTDTTRGWYQFTTAANLPPVFGTPTPTDGAINQNWALSWSISITDPESDLIDYRISCSNGQFTDVAGATGGVKTLSLTGLSPSITYTVWVNATDPAGSGAWTRASFTFTTKANEAPDEPVGSSDPNPVNGASTIPTNLGFLRVYVTDPESQTMTVRFYWGNGTLIGTDTSVASGSTASIAIPPLEYNTTYYWYVNITDSMDAYTLGPSTGNWSFETEAYVPKTGGGGPSVVFHNVYVNVVDDTDSQPIANAAVKVLLGDDLRDEGITTQYGTWSTYLEDDDEYTLTVTANAYTSASTTFTIDHDDVYMTIRMTPVVGVAGLTDASGALTSTGFIFLIIAVLAILFVTYLWWNNKGK